MIAPKRFARIQELFNAALGIPEGERRAFLGAACMGDDSVREEVESLLAEDATSGLLEVDSTAFALPIGTRVGPYEISGVIGRGGMGEVYRARDIKLHREVALKVLPERIAKDPARISRFRREAHLLAALNHPHIAGIHALEEWNGALALVMELISGPTLAERIAAGPVPLDEALGVAKQIAEALQSAHDRGIIHRDLKSANVKITSEGSVKVLDFGLAKALQTDAGAADSDASSPATLSQAGVILGSAAYMSPEQARGAVVDKRADVWAFGVVLYEILTGRRPFEGDTISDTLAAVLTSEPDLRRIPPHLRPVVERCLRKDPRQRWQCIGDVQVALQEEMVVYPARGWARPKVVLGIPAAVMVALLGALALTGRWRVQRAIEQPLISVNMDLGTDALTGLNTTVAVAPDGRRIVYPVRGPQGERQLATRLLDQDKAMVLTGSEGAYDPFFSPDGRWVGFFALSALKKISVRGGVPVTLCPASIGTGASWTDDGDIVAALGSYSTLSRVPSGGGRPERLTKLNGELAHRWPQVLPNRENILFTSLLTNGAEDNASIKAVSLNTGKVKTLLQGGYFGRYAPGGHLLYIHNGALFGVAFDPVRLEVRGAPTLLVEHVAANPLTGGGQFDFSLQGAGILAYLAGGGGAQDWQVARLDSSGEMQPLIATPRSYVVARVSPDGNRLAVQDSDDIYVYDLEHAAMSRLTHGEGGRSPAWAPDGQHLVLQRGGFTLWWMRSDGAAGPQRLFESQHFVVPWSFSPDGRHLAYFEVSPDTGFDIWSLPLDSADPDHPRPGKPEPFLRTSADELVPRFSPDGRWIAYQSNESGTAEIYVRPFPGVVGRSWRISTQGGLYAMWSNNGRELFYESADNRIMVVEYAAGNGSFIATKPRIWSDKKIFFPGVSNVDLFPDGRRFAVLTATEAVSAEKGSVHATFLVNFFDELRRRMPAN